MKIDLHCHTNYSVDSPSSIEELVIEAKRKGLDSFAITDHNTGKGWKEATKMSKKHHFPIILGQEIFSKKGDIIGLFLKKEINGLRKDPEWVMKEIKKQNGLVIIPHPFFSVKEGFKKKDLEKYVHLVDGIEVNNAKRPIGDHGAKEFAKKYNLAMTAGSDSHYYKSIGDAYTYAQAKNIKEFRKKLEQRKTQARSQKEEP